MSTIRFALLSTARDVPDDDAFDELHEHLLASGIAVEPLRCPSYAALHQAVDAGACAFAWAPPFVARSLVRSGDAVVLAAVARDGSTSYLSALVTLPSSHVRSLADLSLARVGWVSRLSAAGYVVPRRRLAALGVELCFAEETFLHSHAALVAALLRGRVDVVATYGTLVGRPLRLPHLEDPRVLAVAAPIPGEVIVASTTADVDDIATVEHALLAARVDSAGALATRLRVSGFTPVPADFLDVLDRWTGPLGVVADEAPITQRSSGLEAALSS